MSFIIKNSFVYEYYINHKKKSKSEIVRDLLSRPNLNIKVEFKTEEETKQIEQANNVCKARLNDLVNRVQKSRWFVRFPDAKEETFFNLANYPDLIRDDDSQSIPDSQTSTSSVLEEIYPDPPVKRKAFDDYSVRTKRAKTDDPYHYLLEQAKLEGFEEEPWRYIAYLGQRASHQKSKKIARQFRNIYEGKDETRVEESVALNLREEMQIGRTAYQTLKRVMKQYQVEYPTWDDLNKNIATFMPEMEHTYDDNGNFNGVVFNLKDMLEKTIERVLNLADLEDEVIEDIKQYGLVAKVNSGADGSGDHQVYNQASSLVEGIDTTHIIFSGFTLISLHVNNLSNTEIFRERSPQSSEAERPLQIVPGKEDDETFGKVMQRLNREVDMLNNQEFEMKCNIGQVKIKTDAHIKQLDGKAQATASGLRGAYCKCCKVKRKAAKDVNRIKQGFTMDRDIVTTWQLFDDLADEDGNVDLGSNAERYGLTQEPMVTTEILKQFPITHAYINLLRYFCMLIYRTNSGLSGPTLPMGKHLTKKQWDDFKKAKNEFREKAKQSLGLKVDQPTIGGSTNTGNVARRFFESRNRQKIIDLFNGTESEKKALGELHRRFSVILKLISSKKTTIDVDSMEQYCTDTYVLLVESFGQWATVPGVVHHLLAHSAERIRLNEYKGLGEWSEEGLEACNKLVRRFRKMLARKTNLKDNFTDVIKRLLVRSDPTVRSHKRVFICSHCNAKGHTKRSCPSRRKAKFDAYDDIVKDFFL